MTSPRPRLRRAALAAAALLASIPQVAAAAPTIPVPSGYVTDGVVNATATDASGRIYIGGEFFSVGPLTGSAWLADPTNGERVSGFPQTDGVINAIEPDSAGGWYVGGSFSTIGGVKRQNVAHVFADGQVNPDWSPTPNGPVNAIALRVPHLYIGGSFSSVTGKPRSRLARLNMGDVGTVDPNFIPDASATSIDVLENAGGIVYAGGTSLSSIAGQPCPGVCRMSSTTVTAAPAIDTTWQAPSGFSSVKALAFDADSVFVGGAFNTIGGATFRNGLAKLSRTTAGLDPSWDPDASVSPAHGIRALAVVGSQVYVGGSFPVIDGQSIANLARVSATGTGDVDTTWTPDAIDAPVNGIATAGSHLYAVGDFLDIGGATRRRAAKFSIAAGSDAGLASWNPGFNDTANAVAVSPSGNVLIGGWFTSGGAKNLERRGVARFDAGGKFDTTWNPRAGAHVNALATAGDSVYIGGDIDTINGHGAASDVVKVSQSGTGLHDTTWAPTTGTVPGLSEVTALAASGGDLFVGQGVRTTDDTFSSDSLIKVSTTGTGAEDTTWNPGIDGAIRALLVSGTDLFVGGDFQSTSIGGSVRSYLAKLSTTGTGTANPNWDPQPDGRVFALAQSGNDLFIGGEFGNVDAAPRTYAAKVAATGAGAVDAEWAPLLNNTVRALAVSGGQVYAGGAFTTAGGENLKRLARFSASGTATVDAAFQPDPVLPVHTLLATPALVVAGGQFPALRGRDGRGLAFFDLAPPTISLKMPGDGPRPAIAWRQGSTATVSFSCEDEGGVVESCIGTQPNGAALDTSKVGTHTFTVTATDDSGNTATKSASYDVEAAPPAPTEPVPPTARNVPPPAPKDLVAPVLSKVKLSAKSFKAARSGPSTVVPTPTKKGKLPRLKAGTRITLTLTEAATIRGTLIVPKKGKKKAKTAGSFTQAVAAGSSRFDFTGRVSGKKLKPGKYALQLVAVDAAGNASKVAALSFTIKR